MLFKIISSNNLNDLSDQIQAALNDKWILHERPFEYCGKICQAMVRII